MKSNEMIQAGELIKVLKELKGFTDEEIDTLFKASIDAKEYQLMLMHVLVRLKMDRPTQRYKVSMIARVIEDYKTLRENQGDYAKMMGETNEKPSLRIQS